MTVAAVVYAPDNTGAAIADTNVTDANGYARGLLRAEFTEQLAREHEVAIEVHRSHPSVSAFTPLRVVRLLDGDGLGTMFRIESVDDVTIDGDPSREVVTVRGRSLLADWRRVKLRPHGNNSDVLASNFATPGMDVTAWTDSVVIADRSALMSWGAPIGWPDPYTAAVWSATQTDGTIFGRRPFTLASGGKYVFYVSGDSGFSLWIDGERYATKWQEVNDTFPVWWAPWRGAAVELDAGSHLLAIEGRREGSVGSLWVSAWPTTGTKLGPGYPIILTGPSSNTAEPIGVWNWLNYPATRPAPPCVLSIHQQLARWQAAGRMGAWSLSFSSSLDSAGAAVSKEEFSLSLTGTGFDLLDLIESAGWMEFSVPVGPGLVLDGYAVPHGSHTGESYSDTDLASFSKRVSV